VVSELIVMAGSSRELVVGFDFATSMPAWFLEQRGLRSAHELWSLVASDGEDWLRTCDPPFWGLPGKKKIELGNPYRRTEAGCKPVAGIAPKSVFQISGPGSVGRGSLRGMHHLRDLYDAGFSIWPFDPPGLPLVVEIYPRVLTGAVTKTDPAARREYLKKWSIPPGLLVLAEGSDDAFDAAISALVMSQHSDELRNLRQTKDPVVMKEGEIWIPLDHMHSGGGSASTSAG